MHVHFGADVVRAGVSVCDLPEKFDAMRWILALMHHGSNHGCRWRPVQTVEREPRAPCNDTEQPRPLWRALRLLDTMLPSRPSQSSPIARATHMRSPPGNMAC
jgi:hypothetical protein